MANEKSFSKKNTQKKEEKELKKCFIITPIGASESIEYKKLCALEKNVYNKILKKFNFELIVAHKINQTGSIGDQVIKNIIDSDLIIANLTEKNANVMYELAVAHSFRKRTVMICEDTTKIPFDLIVDRIIFYSDTIEGCGILEEELSKKIYHLLEEDTFDNPVYRVLERDASREVKLDENKLPTNLLFQMQDQIDSIARTINKSSAAQMYTKSGWQPAQAYIRREHNFNAASKDYWNSSGSGYIVFNNEIVSKKVRDILFSIFNSLSRDLNRLPTYEEIAAEAEISLDIIRDSIRIQQLKN